MLLPIANAWYAIQVKGRQEAQVSESLQSKGYETFVPLYKVMRRWSDRNKAVEVPLFPSYIFCRFDPQIKFTIISTPGVTRIIGFGQGPAPVNEDEIMSLKKMAQSGVAIERHAFFHAGQEVEVVSGPLSGIKGVVASNGRKTRLVISVQLIQSSAAVDVDVACVVATNRQIDQYFTCKLAARLLASA
jgi:transcription elongation factor/antiterminator RfaH